MVVNRKKVTSIQPPALSAERSYSHLVGLEATTIRALFLFGGLDADYPCWRQFTRQTNCPSKEVKNGR